MKSEARLGEKQNISSQRDQAKIIPVYIRNIPDVETSLKKVSGNRDEN